MDENNFKARTDILVIIDVIRQKLIWVPRDLYCELIGARINVAYRRGGEKLLLECLKEFDYKVNYAICILPKLLDIYFTAIGELLIPVKEDISFYYPTNWPIPIEQTRKTIYFSSPNTLLKGERFHQWIGARYCISNKSQIVDGDIGRIIRQQQLIKELIKIKYNFNIAALKNKNIIQGLRYTDIFRIQKLYNIRYSILDAKKLYFSDNGMYIKLVKNLKNLQIVVGQLGNTKLCYYLD